ncbi:Sec39-domain-containing protein [Phellopilus nigrolimitatus]|nr:Sec39-domain-containing protein [Phellopilus nigrolimitatus]
MTSPTDAELCTRWTALDDLELTDDLWAAAACVDRRFLLDLGIRRTASAESGSSDPNDLRGTVSAYFSSHIRSVLLQQVRDSLAAANSTTYSESDADEGWEDDPWADTDTEGPPTAPLPLSVFLTEDVSLMCLALASQMQFLALKIIIQRHNSSVFPHRFQIITRIPLFADPSDYRDLLPAIDSQSGMESFIQGSPWRNVKLACSQVALPSTDCHKRVEVIVSSTGLVDMALSLVQHGVSQGVVGLDELGEDLSLVSRLVYDSPGSETGGSAETISISEWVSLEPRDVVRRYLAHSAADTIVNDIRRLVMPYLFVLESRCERAGKPDSGLFKRLLYDYILHANLDVVVPIFEASKPTLVASQRLISDDEDLARLALACLYGSSSLYDWANMSRIFECLPAWNFEAERDEEDEVDTTVASLSSFLAPSTSRPHSSPSDLLVFFKPLPAQSLSRALDILDVHLESGEILSRWGVPVPLRWFLQSAHDEAQQRAWAMKMARQNDAPSGDLDSEEVWLSLLEDMLKLTRPEELSTNSAFGALSGDDVRQIFFRGLLSTGKFTIAKRVALPRHGERLLSPDVIESLCLDCSREFYDNASSGNYNFGDMKLAYDCLSVAPQSPAILKEREFIEATSRISSFNVTSRPGVPILPIEIRLTKDKLNLVARVLSSNESAYKHVEVLLELVRKLGFREDVLAEVKMLAMVADTALQAEDFPRAFEASDRMVNAVVKLRQTAPFGADSPQVREAVEVCWVACFQLGRQSEAEDVDRKMALLGRALELCPPDKIVDILTSWRKLEAEDIDRRQRKTAERQWRNQGGAKQAGDPRGRMSTLSSKLQDIHMPSPALPSASALASHTFNRVAASFPFSMHGHPPD